MPSCRCKVHNPKVKAAKFGQSFFLQLVGVSAQLFPADPRLPIQVDIAHAVHWFQLGRFGVLQNRTPRLELGCMAVGSLLDPTPKRTTMCPDRHAPTTENKMAQRREARGLWGFCSAGWLKTTACKKWDDKCVSRAPPKLSAIFG